jgi:hypothetical protein
MSQVLRYILETSACLILFYGVYWLFLRRETYFLLNRVYLLASLALSFVIPALHVPSPFLTVPVSPAPVGPAAGTALPAPSPGAAEIIFLVYAAGALVFLARFGYQLIRLFRVVRKFGSRDLDGAKLVSVDRDFAPFSFLKYIFINDREFNPGNLRHILAHEQAHIRQGHSLDVLLVELATIVQWFNPIVRPYKRSIQETHEFLADGEVIAQGFNSARYQLVMLEQQVGSRLLEFSNNFKQSQIKRRIVMMSQTRSKGASRLKVLVLMPLAVLLVLALAQPRPVATADPALESGLQDKSDQSQDEMKKKEMLIKATESLAVLKEKEAKLKKALETAVEPEKQKELEHSLQIILELRKNTEAFLKNPETVPPPPPLPPPAPVGKAGLKMLQEKESALRKALDSENDPEKQQELKETLDKVLMKQKDLEARLGNQNALPFTPPTPPTPPNPADPAAPPSPPQPPVPPDRETLYRELQAKEAAILAEMEKTQDAEKIARLKETVDKLRQKQAQLKAEQDTLVLSADKLKQMTVELQEKEKEVRAELEKTKDSERTAELKDTLKKLAQKQEILKAKIENLKNSPEEKK